MKHPAIVLCVYLLSLSGAVFAVDTDGDGSDSVEEALAGTSDSDPTKRPYWQRTIGEVHDEQGGHTQIYNTGDVNQDGYDDISIAYLYGDSEKEGSVYILSGQTGNQLYHFKNIDYVAPGSLWNGFFGQCACAIGDVNGDGYVDFTIGASADNAGGNLSGSVFVFSGINGSILYNLQGNAYDQIRSVGEIGDINRDGTPDFLLVASQGPYADPYSVGGGYVKVINGANGSTLFTFAGGPQDHFANSAGGAGDVNGDSYPDLVIGTETYDEETGEQLPGYVQIFSGSDGSVIRTLSGIGVAGLDAYGYGAGDVNNDDYADIALLSRTTFVETVAPVLQLFSGADSSLLYTLNASDTQEDFALSFSALGDINGDGYDDFAVGAPRALIGGARKGSVRIYSGATGAVLFALVGDNANDNFGFSLAGGADMNNDGLPDLAIYALGNIDQAPHYSYIRVFLSSDLKRDNDLDLWIDTDMDGVEDYQDAFPLDLDEWLDTDNDGIGNNADWDDDGDSVPDVVDASPLDGGGVNEIPLPLDGTYKGGQSSNGMMAQ